MHSVSRPPALDRTGASLPSKGSWQGRAGKDAKIAKKNNLQKRPAYFSVLQSIPWMSFPLRALRLGAMILSQNMALKRHAYGEIRAVYCLTRNQAEMAELTVDTAPW